MLRYSLTGCVHGRPFLNASRNARRKQGRRARIPLPKGQCGLCIRQCDLPGTTAQWRLIYPYFGKVKENQERRRRELSVLTENSTTLNIAQPAGANSSGSPHVLSDNNALQNVPKTEQLIVDGKSDGWEAFRGTSTLYGDALERPTEPHEPTLIPLPGDHPSGLTTPTATSFKEDDANEIGEDDSDHQPGALVTIRPWASSSSLPPLPFPAETCLEICKHVKTPADLARLAMVCTGLNGIAEETLYKHVRITSRRALEDFSGALWSGPHKVQWVRTFTFLDQSVDTDPVNHGRTQDMMAALVDIMRSLRDGKLKHVEIKTTHAALWMWFEDQPGAHAPRLPQSVRSLSTTPSFSSVLDARLAPLTSLSMSTLLKSRGARPEIARFRTTLRRLRICRGLPWRLSKDSPARVIAELDLPLLEYFELEDQVNPKVRGRHTIVRHVEMYSPRR